MHHVSYREMIEIDQYAYKVTGNAICALIDITHTVGKLLETNRYVRCVMLAFQRRSTPSII